VLHNFNADGFESLYPRYAGGRPPVFTLAQRREIKKIAKSCPGDHGLPFSRWSLAKLAEFLVAEGVVDDISHEGLRELLRAENVSFQAVKTWKASADPDYAAKKARVDQLYAIADGEGAEVVTVAGESDVVPTVCSLVFRAFAPGPVNGVRSPRSVSEKPVHGAHPAITQREYVHPAERGTAGRAEPPGLGGGVGTGVRRAVLLQHEVGRSVVENLPDAVAGLLAPHESGF
jgi:hypothetical protein